MVMVRVFIVCKAWMCSLGKTYRKQVSWLGALRVHHEDDVRVASDYSPELKQHFLDPGNHIYARAFMLAFPSLSLYNWNPQTLGDIFEAILGLWYTRALNCIKRGIPTESMSETCPGLIFLEQWINTFVLAVYHFEQLCQDAHMTPSAWVELMRTRGI
jgi:hypothetical protein